MPIVDLIMPKMGESITEATILKWHKQPGESVKQDETVLDIATDKVDSEIPSSVAGTLSEILFRVNDVVPVGAVFARVNTGVAEPVAGTETAPAPGETAVNPEPPARVTSGVPAMANTDAPSGNPYSQTPGSNGTHPARDAGAFAYEGPDLHAPFSFGTAFAGSSHSVAVPGKNGTGTPNRFYSPLVLNIAGNEGVGFSELEKIPGTGNEGRVTKKDILQYVSWRKDGTNPQTAGSQTADRRPQAGEMQPAGSQTAGSQTAGSQTAGSQTAGSQTTARRPQTGEIQTAESHPADRRPPNENAPAYNGEVEIVEMDRMRRLIADHMVRSKQTSPHVTSFSEADVTNLVLWQKKQKAAFEKDEGTRLTLTPLFLEAIIRCIKKFPMINSSLQGDRILIKKDINIGMATALPNGNLIVPVIKHAGDYNRAGLARRVNQLAAQARDSKLRPEDIQDGTFTVTNVGIFGSLMGVPIINQPQSAILATGVIKKRPVVIETEQGDSIGIRHMMYLSMSYDHRIIDGALGASFLTAVARELEAFSE